ncbi:MAG: STAS-like domain-containing protein [Eubacterium sp.]|nr:STAS-like domain-containing protein [Eubacterium sp.]
MKIKVSSFSKEAATKSKGLVLREEIEKGLHTADEINVDFSDINRFASPFFNNSFAALALKYGFDKIEKISCLNLSDVGLDAYESSMENAKMLSSSPEFADEMTKIIQETPKNTEE